MKKSIVSLFLAGILLSGATNGMVNSVASVEANKDTPVSQIVNDEYVPYDYVKKTGAKNTEEESISSITNEVKSAGGYVKTYSSEEEYLNAQKPASAKTASNFNVTSESVRQTIKVMTTALGSVKNDNYVESKPVHNAIVRINGIPRYTDRNGEIKVTLNKNNYVELFVEKEGYNPYIEIMEVTGEDKTVHIKQPCDDIDIYDIELNYDGKTAHILNQEFFVMRDLDDSCYSSITIKSNIIYNEKSDVIYESYFLVNGVQELYQKGNIISNLYLGDYSPSDKFSIYIVYDGVKSKTYDLLLNIVEFSDEEDDNASADESEENSIMGLPVGNDNLGLFSGFNMNLKDLKKLKKYFIPNKPGTIDFDFETSYNYYTGKLSVSIGFSYEKFKERPTDKELFRKMKSEVKEYKEEKKTNKQEKKELNKELAAAQKKYEDYKNSINTAELERLQEQVNNWKSKIDEANKDENKSDYYFRTMAKNSNELLKKEQESLNAKNAHAKQLLDDVNNGKKKLEDLDEELSKIPGMIKSARQSFNQHTKGIVIGFNILGVFEYNFHKCIVENLSINVGASIGVKVKGTFMVWVIPMFYEVYAGIEVSVKFKVINNDHEIMTLEEFLSNIFAEVAFKLRAEVGVGINDFLGLSVYAQLRGGIRLYPLASGQVAFGTGDDIVILDGIPYIFNPLSWGYFLEWRVALRLEVLIFDFELGYEDIVEREAYLPNHKVSGEVNKEKSLDSKSVQPMSYMSRSVSIEDENIYDFDNIYQNSKPQLVQINGKKMLIWIEDSLERDNYNRTTLKYSIYNNDGWSEPKSVYDDGRADFSHNTYIDGNDLYVTWQKGNRHFNELDDYISMGKDCDIFVAKYDEQKDCFAEIKNISSDGSLDFAPKFILKENASDPLSIVWQKNSVNDMIGMSGTNSLVCASMENGEWSDPTQTYQTDHYISCVTSTYKDGELVTVFLENQTGDYSDKKDYILKLVKNRNVYDISEEGEEASNPQFNIKDGKAQLFYYSEEHILFTQDFVNTFTFGSMEAGKVNDTFNIISTDNGYAFFYNTVVGDYIQPMCTLYNAITGEWTYNIKLSEESNDTANVIGFISDDNRIMAVYNIRDDKHNTAMNYAEVDLTPDFSIENVFYNMDAQEGELINLNIGISNIGNVNLSNFTVQAFGQTINTVSPISIGEYKFINVDIVFEKSSDIELVTVLANEVKRSYELKVQYSDVKIDGNVSIKSGKQFFNLVITNAEIRDENIELVVYKGEETIYNEYIMVTGVSSVEKNISFDNLQVGDALHFEIITNENDRYQIDNSVVLRSIMNTTISDEVHNPYYSVLDRAKGIIYAE